MDRRNTIALALGVISAPALVVAQNTTAVAAPSDADAVKTALDSFHAALSALDIKKMEAVWAHDPYVMLINPRDKAPSIGWANVRKNWEATFAFWSDLKVGQSDGPHIHVDGRVAWLVGTAIAGGQPKNGNAIPGAPTFESTVFEKRGNKWLVVSHSAWRAPQ